MGFTTGDFPPVDPPAFLQEPLQKRLRVLSTHWAEYGFGTPRNVHTIYIAKLLFLYIIGGITIATQTSGLGWAHVGQWWHEPVVYQKFILWTVLLESVGMAGSWGPLAGKFKPMIGGVLWWTRPGSIRLPPWPDKVPGTKGDSRTIGDVALYVVYIASIILALVAPVHRVAREVGRVGMVRPEYVAPVVILLVLLGLRDKVILIAARGEQYIPALIIFTLLGPTDMIIGLKLLIVSVWICAGVSKFGKHFSHVIPPMVSNTPFFMPKFMKLKNYRDFPNDLRPAVPASLLAHIGGTCVEIVTPLVLLFSHNTDLTIAAICVMVLFHLFITATFPLAVPLEWNILFAYATIALFGGHQAKNGFAISDMSHVWITVLVIACLVFFPILGNLRPDLVSFLPSMRQYAGNWATALWAFAPGAEARLNSQIVTPARTQVEQLTDLYPAEVAEVTMQQTLGWRAMHSQGRGLFSLLMTHLGDNVDTYTIREAEFICNSLIGFNFGDGHLHDEKMLAAVQKRCNFAPGEVTVVWVESEAINRGIQDYKVIDIATGVLERGTWNVADAVEEQPWLPNGPIPLTVTWSAVTGSSGYDLPEPRRSARRAPKAAADTQPA